MEIMVRQAQPNYFALIPAPQRAPAASARSIWLGPLQRVKLALHLPFIRQGAPLRMPPKPLWFEKGWRQAADAHQYTGQYKAGGHTWRGLIQQPYPGGYTAYIWDPPLKKIRRNTSHGPCFMPNDETGRYQVHFHTAPSSLDHAITSIERVLTEACTGRP